MDRRESAPHRRAGLTLIEVTVAIAILMIVLSAMAQAMISSYAALDIQQQRTIAAQSCRSVLNRMRAVRDADSGPFPAIIHEVNAQSAPIEDFPADTPLPNRKRLLDGGIETAWPLSQQVVTVSYQNPDANPLELTVMTTWLDLQGRRAQLSISSAISSD